MIKKYRKKPVVIDAVEWTGDNLREIINFTGLHPSASRWTWKEYQEVVAKDGLKIFTLEGSHLASIGDFIIKGVKGEFYPCKPDILALTYEPVNKDSLSYQLAEALVDEICDDEMKHSAQYYDMIDKLQGLELTLESSINGEIDDQYLLKVINEIMIEVMSTPAEENFRPGVIKILRKLISDASGIKYE